MHVGGRQDRSVVGCNVGVTTMCEDVRCVNVDYRNTIGLLETIKFLE